MKKALIVCGIIFMASGIGTVVFDVQFSPLSVGTMWIMYGVTLIQFAISERR